MPNIADIPLTRLDGAPDTLGAHKGKVLLVVNVASKCGLTPQYEGLEKLYEAKRGQGLEVLGFPANNFGAQEPGTNEEISDFCSTNYGVKFPMFSKISVVGADKHPLYAELTKAQPNAANEGAMRERLAGYGMTPNPVPEVLWNFEKFVVGKTGEIVARFSPDTTPDDPNLNAVLDAELAKPAYASIDAARS
jgi:glutathione peroxidase